MNFGSGNFLTSGELTVIKDIAANLDKSKRITFFDIGANVGDYATSIADIFNNQITIYAFEPSKLTFATLKDKTSNVDCIHLFNFGLSDKTEEMKLFYDKPNSLMASVYERDLANVNVVLDNTETVQFSTVDAFCKEHSIQEIDFLKIDVEGHEINVLNGAKGMLNSNKVKFVQFEFGEACIDSKTYLKDFYCILPNFNFYRIVSDGLHPLGEYKTEYEIFKTVNLLAINKGLNEQPIISSL